MNNENNNLNGAVLGNVGIDPMQENNVGTINDALNNQIVTPDNNASGVVNPTTNDTPTQSVVTPNPVQSNNTVVNPIPVQPVNNVVSGEQVVNPAPEVQQQPNVQAQQPTPQAQPAYTSINQINPNNNPMPGFDSTIGTTPPISLEQEKEPKKNNKTTFIVIVMLLILAVAGGTYYVLNYTDLLSKKETINLTVNSIILTENSELSTDISTYANVSGTSISNCLLDISNVDVTKTGVYKYNVTCSNVSKEGIITIVEDEQKEKVYTKIVYLKKGNAVEAKDFIFNPTSDNVYTFEDEDAVQKILNGDYGTYTINIKITNSNGKEQIVNASLVLLEYNIKGYTICTKESEENNIKNTISNKFAIFDDGNNSFGNVASEKNIFEYNSEEDFNNIVNEFNNSGNEIITINNIKGYPLIDSDAKTITIENYIDADSVYKKYGKDNIKNYNTIRTYFRDTLGYTCVYEKAND